MVVDGASPDGISERMRHGDQQALAELFARHRERLWRIIFFRLDPRMQARIDPDDVLQEAFLDASLRLPHFGEKQELSPFVWLRMIVGQTLIDIHRRHTTAQRNPSREVFHLLGGFPNATGLSLAIGLLDRLTSPSQSMMRSEQAENIRAAINSLELIDQEIISLRHFEELSNKEVAEALGIGQKAASIRYVRAINRLRSVLSEMPEYFNALSATTSRAQNGRLPR